MINATLIDKLGSWPYAEMKPSLIRFAKPASMPCLCLSHHQRRLESCDAAGWVRCQKCRGYVSRERMEDGR